MNFYTNLAYAESGSYGYYGEGDTYTSSNTPHSAAHIGFVGVPTYILDKGVALRTEFQRLVKEWKKDTLDISSLSDMVMHHSYLQIIALGSKVIPLLVDELRNDPDHWFVALAAITQENPVMPDDDGDLVHMTQAWLDWAKNNGY